MSRGGVEYFLRLPELFVLADEKRQVSPPEEKDVKKTADGNNPRRTEQTREEGQQQKCNPYDTIRKWYDSVSEVCTDPYGDEEGYDVYYNHTIMDLDKLEEIGEQLTETRRRQVAVSIVKGFGLVRHQIEHFEKFMDVYLPRIVHENSNVVVESEAAGRRFVMEFGNIVVYKPTIKEANGVNRPIFPWECRARNLTYAVSVVCDVTYTAYDITGMTREQLQERGGDCTGLKVCDTRVSRETLLCQVPCPLYSKYCHLHRNSYLSNECPFDKGGMFPINGSEKDLISQEITRHNFPFVFAEKAPSKYIYCCEIRSCHETKVRSTSTLYTYITGSAEGGVAVVPEVTVEIPYMDKVHIPLAMMFRLLGVDSIEEMREMVLEHNPRYKDDPDMLRLVERVLGQDLYNVPHAELCDWVGREGMKESIREKRIRYVEHLLANEVLPHIGLDRTPETFRKKAHAFSGCVWKLLAVYLKRLKADDRDHNMAKRVNTPLALLAIHFRPQFRTLLKYAATYLRRCSKDGKPINVADAINHKRITSSLKYALSTGNWGQQKGGSSLTGVAQVHNRMTLTSGYSNLRKINNHINKEGKMPKPRQLNISHWGLICPAETPEGQSCGLLRNMALGNLIRIGYEPEYILEFLRLRLKTYLPILNTTRQLRSTGIRITVNGGKEDGYIPFEDGDKAVVLLRKARQTGAIPFDTAIVYRPMLRTLVLHVDGGCQLRPLFKVENLPMFGAVFRAYHTNDKLLVQQLILAGVLEYICKEEEETLRVAVLPEHLYDPTKNTPDEPYTHVEVHPTLIGGVCFSLTPFPNHDQAPRNTYQSAMQKQSEAVTGFNMEHRADTQSQTLWYPQEPVVQTFWEKALGLVNLAMGQNAKMGVLCYNYNQEDSLCINESALERGLFRGYKRRTYRDEENTRGTDCRKFEKPLKRQCRSMRKANYETLNPITGIVDPGTLAQPNDVIIGKTMSADEIADPDAPKFLENGQKANTGHQSRIVKRCNSTILRTNEPAVVEKVVDTKNKDGNRAAKVVTRAMRQPELGDKFSSRFTDNFLLVVVVVFVIACRRRLTYFLQARSKGHLRHGLQAGGHAVDPRQAKTRRRRHPRYPRQSPRLSQQNDGRKGDGRTAREGVRTKGKDRRRHPLHRTNDRGDRGRSGSLRPRSLRKGGRVPPGHG